jgi:putative transposase
MPYRNTPIIVDEIYHVYNRSVGSIPIFLSNKDYQHFYDVVDYYRFSEVPIRFSYFTHVDSESKKSIYKSVCLSPKLITILGFAFMPNHFHFVLKQNTENGLSTFMRLIQNSYAKYYNLKYKRFGPLYQSMFKCLRISKDDQNKFTPVGTILESIWLKLILSF